MSPALAGGFLSIVPPGKPSSASFIGTWASLWVGVGGGESWKTHHLLVLLELQGLELQSVALLAKEYCFPGMGQSTWYLLLYPCSPSRVSASAGEVTSDSQSWWLDAGF